MRKKIMRSKRKSSREHNKSLSLVTKAFVEFGRGFDHLGVSCIECLALVSGWKLENLDAMNGGVVGVFIAQPPNLTVGGGCLFDGAPDSPVPQPRHQCRWILTVGVLTSGPAWMSGGAPDMHCRVSGAPVWACLTSARAARAFNAS
jgi:hypothetical protein